MFPIPDLSGTCRGVKSRTDLLDTLLPVQGVELPRLVLPGVGGQQDRAVVGVGRVVGLEEGNFLKLIIGRIPEYFGRNWNIQYRQ